jgi:hypothetical protein
VTDVGDQDSDIVEDREHVTISREPRPDAPDRYHVADPLEHLKTFDALSKARLYADVYAVVGGFREEKTGERGVPPAVAAARENVLIAYLTAQPTMSLTYTARFFDEPEAVVRRAVNSVQARAAEQRESTDD